MLLMPQLGFSASASGGLFSHLSAGQMAVFWVPNDADYVTGSSEYVDGRLTQKQGARAHPRLPVAWHA